MFITVILVVLLILSAILLFVPVLKAESLNNSLVEGSLNSGATYSYIIESTGGTINFYKENALSKKLSNMNFIDGYINVTVESEKVIFNIRLYYQNVSTSLKVKLAKSFNLVESKTSEITRSFFPNNSMGRNTIFIDVFNLTAKYTGKSTYWYFSSVSNGRYSLNSISEKFDLINVPQEPKGFFKNVTKQSGGNYLYYINSRSGGAFLSYLFMSGNSSVIAALFDNSSVSNVTLFSIKLQKTNVGVDTLNLSYYLDRYLAIVPLLWIIGVVYMVSIYRRISRKGRR